jgi:hypothetical protein
MMTDQSTAAYGEQLHLIYAKACESPDDLSASDLFVLDSYFFNIVNRIRREMRISQVSGFYADEQWLRHTRNSVSIFIFRTYAGRDWWQRGRSWLDPDLIAAGDKILSSLGDPDCGKRVSDYHEYLRSEMPAKPQ